MALHRMLHPIMFYSYSCCKYNKSDFAAGTSMRRASLATDGCATISQPAPTTARARSAAESGCPLQPHRHAWPGQGELHLVL